MEATCERVVLAFREFISASILPLLMRERTAVQFIAQVFPVWHEFVHEGVGAGVATSILLWLDI
jgi:hypothetical protein